MKKKSNKRRINIFAVLKPYKWHVTGLVLLTVLGNGLSLLVPKIIAGGIDSYLNGQFVAKNLYREQYPP